MAAFIFTGDPKAPKSDPDECILFGMTFPKDIPVKVEDQEIAARLRRHSHFTERRVGRPPKNAESSDG